MKRASPAPVVGAHVRGADPLAEAAAVGAACVQIFLGDPQSWRKAPPRPDAAALRHSPIPVYVHAPYPINVASPNNRVRVPSRRILLDTLEGAAEIGAAAVIVHAGHAEDGVEHGFVRWWKVFEELRPPVPLLIENTAGGVNAMGRSVETLTDLWRRLQGAPVGFCFDTCHAHAAGQDPVDMAHAARESLGGVVLVHANSSRDPFGSGRDRHANFAAGEMDPDAIARAVEACGAAAAICETPWEGIAADVAFLRRRLV
ncbi:MAG: deoxyribonuclease IV [Gemmatimonadota bacterium]